MNPHQCNGPTPSALALQSKLAASARRRSLNPTVFKPNWIFLYGSLMDPEVLQSLLGLQDSPRPDDAVVTGFRLKMWGIYPALVRDPDHATSENKGKVYWLQTFEQLAKLETYETEAYSWGHCNIRLADGTMVRDAHVFEWAHRRNIRELDDGNFELERFQRHVKPSLLGKSSELP